MIELKVIMQSLIKRDRMHNAKGRPRQDTSSTSALSENALLRLLPSYLNPGLGEPDPQCELLPHEYVRVVRLAEVPLQLPQLRRTEARSVPFRLAPALVVVGRTWRS